MDIFAFIQLALKAIATGEKIYSVYQQLFGNKPSIGELLDNLESQLEQFIDMTIEKSAIFQAQGDADAATSYMTIDIPNLIAQPGTTDADVYAELTDSQAGTLLVNVQQQAGVMEQWSLDPSANQTEAMQAIQTLPVYLTLGQLVLGYYQMRAMYAPDAATQQAEWADMQQYASQFAQRAAAILSALQGWRTSYVVNNCEVTDEWSNPPNAGESGEQKLDDHWIKSDHSMLLYYWQTNEGLNTKTNQPQMQGQVDTLVAQHLAFLQAGDEASWQAIMTTASKGNGFPQATHFEDYFGKHPSFDPDTGPNGGYAAAVYQYAQFANKSQASIDAFNIAATQPMPG